MTEAPTREDWERLAGQTAAGLAEMSAHYAFRLFRDEHFRRQDGFKGLDQGEQDRIFNELVCAHLTLIMLLIEAPDLRAEKEFVAHLGDVKERIPGAYVEKLRSMGIEDKHLRDWEKLIGLRYDEYAKDRHDVRAAAMDIESAEKELDVNDLSNIQLLVPVQAVAIGCHHHVCRGKTEGRDELFKSILRALSRFYVELRIRMEGGKITPLARARMAARRVIRRWSR